MRSLLLFHKLLKDNNFIKYYVVINRRLRITKIPNLLTHQPSNKIDENLPPFRFTSARYGKDQDIQARHI